MWPDRAQSPRTQPRWVELEKNKWLFSYFPKCRAAPASCFSTNLGASRQGSYLLRPPSKTRRRLGQIRASAILQLLPEFLNLLKAISTTCKRPFQQGCRWWLLARDPAYTFRCERNIAVRFSYRGLLRFHTMPAVSSSYLHTATRRSLYVCCRNRFIKILPNAGNL